MLALHPQCLFGLALVVAAGLPCTARTPITVQNDFGVRTIPESPQRAMDGAISGKGNSTYCYLALTAIPSQSQRTQFEAVCRVKLLTVHDVRQGYVIYEAQCMGDLASVELSLRKNVSGFYGIEPVSLQDKVSRKIYARKGFAKCEMDTARGLVWALVRFNRLVSRSTMDSVIEVYADTIAWRSDRFFKIRATPNALLDLAKCDEVEGAHEFDTRIVLYNADARKMSNVDSSQALNVSALPFPPATTTVWRPDNQHYTGDSVSIGIYEDAGVDSFCLDMRERNGSPGNPDFGKIEHDTAIGNTTLRSALPGSYGSAHGLACANVSREKTESSAIRCLC